MAVVRSNCDFAGLASTDFAGGALGWSDLSRTSDSGLHGLPSGTHDEPSMDLLASGQAGQEAGALDAGALERARALGRSPQPHEVAVDRAPDSGLSAFSPELSAGLHSHPVSEIHVGFHPVQRLVCLWDGADRGGDWGWADWAGARRFGRAGGGDGGGASCEQEGCGAGGEEGFVVFCGAALRR